jgi:hypothetical protein
MRHPLTISELALATIELAHSRIPDGASTDTDFAHGDNCIIDFVAALLLSEHESKRTTETLLFFLYQRTGHEAAFSALDLKEHVGYLAFPALRIGTLRSRLILR